MPTRSRADATGGGDDRLAGGPGRDAMAGDSSADSGNSTGSGDDLLDIGPGARGLAIGDHNTNSPGRTASGAGNDRISGGHANDLLIGDSAADNITDAGNDQLDGLPGDDILFGDNTDWTGGHTTGTIGGDDRLSGDPGDEPCSADRQTTPSTAARTSTAATARPVTTRSPAARRSTARPDSLRRWLATSQDSGGRRPRGDRLGTRENLVVDDAAQAVVERVLALISARPRSQRLVRRAWRSSSASGRARRATRPQAQREAR